MPLAKIKFWHSFENGLWPRSYGVAAAALNYFDKALGQLTLPEMAYLAALPKARKLHPSQLRAATHGETGCWTRWYRMAMSGRCWGVAKKASLLMNQQTGYDAAEAPYFTEAVRRQLIRQFGETALYDGGLSVRTTLDPFLQQIADDALARGLEALDRRQGWRGPLGKMPADADIDKTLADETAKLRQNHYAA